MSGPSKNKDEPAQTVFSDPHDILMNVPIGTITTTPDGRLLSTNPATARMYGYESPNELIESVSGITTQLYADSSDREELMRLLN
ncbi:PAS domain-containing protein [Desulfonatronovibrio magnus]|uniref:PAS domain-containing protein n=1 Tax=Desulfonatronovibrio magnus TaxID=698827 RepID=UPI0005EBF396|nr:PAS domain-containing protein [Desulfonatronovibrio magnus]